MQHRDPQPLGNINRRLKVKRGFLIDVARQYSHGCCPFADLELAAQEYVAVKAEKDAKARRGEEDEADE